MMRWAHLAGCVLTVVLVVILAVMAWDARHGHADRATLFAVLFAIAFVTSRATYRSWRASRSS